MLKLNPKYTESLLHLLADGFQHEELVLLLIQLRRAQSRLEGEKSYFKGTLEDAKLRYVVVHLKSYLKNFIHQKLILKAQIHNNGFITVTM